MYRKLQLYFVLKVPVDLQALLVLLRHFGSESENILGLKTFGSFYLFWSRILVLDLFWSKILVLDLFWSQNLVPTHSGPGFLVSGPVLVPALVSEHVMSRLYFKLSYTRSTKVIQGPYQI